MIGAILVGGRSRRMGRDKSTLLRDGRPVLEQTLARLDAVCGRTLLVARDNEQAAAFQGFGAEVIHESGVGRGPLGGLAAALQHADDDVFLLACDLPFIEETLLRTIKAAFDAKHPVALVPRSPSVSPPGWQLEPLCAIWAADPCRDQAMEAMNMAGSKVPSMIGFAWAVQAHWLDLSSEEAAQLRNVNAPEDLRDGLGFGES